MKKLTTEEFILKARNVHGGKYCYSKADYKDANTEVRIICPEHGEFFQKPQNHLSGRGCPECAKESRRKKKSSTTEEFIRKADSLYKDAYGYTYEDTEYVNNHTEVVVHCPLHGDFRRKPSMFLSGGICPKCKHENFYLEKKALFIRKSEELHGGFYDYSKVGYRGNKVPVCIICPIHGEFWQMPNDHICGHGCPKCGANNISENKVGEILMDEFANVCPQKKFEWLKYKKPMSLDYYLPDYKVAVEYQGKQHFCNECLFIEKDGRNSLENNIARDLRKIKLCEEHGIKICHITFEDKSLVPSNFFYKLYADAGEMVNNIKNGTLWE